MAGTWAIFPVMTATNLVATAAVASAKLSKASSAEEALLRVGIIVPRNVEMESYLLPDQPPHIAMMETMILMMDVLQNAKLKRAFVVVEAACTSQMCVKKFAEMA